jgi:16S rRNA (uracil1498-N3)-methyltransferase
MKARGGSACVPAAIRTPLRYRPRKNSDAIGSPPTIQSAANPSFSRAGFGLQLGGMSDFRAFCVPASDAPAELLLSPEESHHLVVVNRARRGDPVVAFDGRGREWLTELSSDKKNAAVLRVKSAQPVRSLPYDITLAQALPKGPGMDAIVRKATEIGAARIVPLETERTQVHLDGDRSDKKVEKWQTAALEAAKQCGNPFVPEVTAVQNASAFLAATQDYDLKLIASLHPGAKSLKAVLADFRTAQGRTPKKVVWLVGPRAISARRKWNARYRLALPRSRSVRSCCGARRRRCTR